MNNEVMRILKMLEDGKISSTEASELISAINGEGKEQTAAVIEPPVPAPAPAPEVIKEKYLPVVLPETFTGEMLKLHVDSNDGDVVDITLPLVFVRGMIKAGFNSVDIKIDNLSAEETQKIKDNISSAIQSDKVGEILNYHSPDGDKIVVIIE